MPKTQNAFAFRELYQKCFRAEFNSREEVDAANDFYRQFLLKGFSMPEISDNKIDERRRTFYEFLYMSRRAEFLTRLIERHQNRLDKVGRLIYNDSAPFLGGNPRIGDLYWNYEEILADMKESAVNFGELAKYQQLSLKKLFAMELGNRLWTARRRLGFSQSQIAYRLNISQEVYSKYEQGKYEMPLYLINELAIILNVSYDWLLGRQPIHEEKETKRRYRLSLW